MRRAFLLSIVLLSASILGAQTADEIIAKYVKTLGGLDKIEAISTVRRTGKFTGGDGFEARISQENKRPDLVREDFLIQGMDGVNAWDGHTGWKIEPWDGKKDAEALGEEEMLSILEDADFDGPLINYQKKGNKVEYVGTEPVEGTSTQKLKVTLANGEVLYYFMDADSGVPIKIETQRMVRGAQRMYETWLGDYKEVSGVYFPFSIETNTKGSQNRQKSTYDKIEAGVTLPGERFAPPTPGGKPPQDLHQPKG